MQATPNVLIAGCGDVGTRLGLQLAGRGWIVHGLRRQVDALPAAIRPVAGDLREAGLPAGWPEGALDYLVYTVAAGAGDEAGYRAAYPDGLRRVLGWLDQRGQRPRRLLFVSSTAVYGQSAGEWIDESSPTEPAGVNGRVLLEAEALARGCGFPVTAVRLGGIYGPGRGWLLEQVRQGYRVPAEPPLYGNRIHADDAAALLAFLLQADAEGRALEDCYLGVDDEPAALATVVDWLRQRLGVVTEAAPSPSRRGGSKRCRNARARALGWAPRYPGFREGYAALLEGR